MSIWYHGSRKLITSFEDPGRAGIHFGTRQQAAQRNSAYLHEVSIQDCRTGRTKDRQDWREVTQRAARRGVSVLRYLNRYEGIPAERIEALAASGDLSKLDHLTDANFQKLVPEADFSIVVTDPGLITLQRVFDRSGELVWEAANPRTGELVCEIC